MGSSLDTMVVARAGFSLVATLVMTGCGGGSAADEGAPAATSNATATTAVTTSTSAPPTTSPPTTTDATADVRDPGCVVSVVSGDSLSKIAERTDGVTVAAIVDENRLTDGHVIHPGDELDVCIGNDVDDVTGASRLAPAPAAVRRQQRHLNELFAPYRIAELAVDGDSGPLTRQLLCAARMGLGLSVSATHMPEGSPDEDLLFAADSLSIPDGAAVWADRWILIDKTCQVMFTGEGERIVDVYPTSTGESGFETRDVQANPAFRFDPALDNGGWHDSSRFPVEIDDPLNGNMYKPIYFNGGQAIHGAEYVPPEPRSKGCARTFPWHQDELIAWLGLDDIAEPTWRVDAIGVTVTVRGDYRPVD
jgi:LysM repeat protein